MKLEASDLHHLNSIQGWLELGNHREAGEELSRVRPDLHDHPAVLLLRWNVDAMARKWEACVQLARTLTEVAPEQDQGWINLGNSLYFSGRTQEAYDCVKPLLVRFPKNPALVYNLACYACQLGNLEEAKVWLERAFTLDPSMQLKRAAKEDPDLEPLWNDLKTG